MELNTKQLRGRGMISDPKAVAKRRERPGRGYRRLCAYVTEEFACSGWAAKGWTTCNSHHTDGRSLAANTPPGTPRGL